MLSHSKVPVSRIRVIHDRTDQIRTDGDFVLYWMISSRRTRWNFGLQRAIDWAIELDKPLVVLEALRASYPWNCDRFHAFVIEGMADNAREFAASPVTYYPYLEPTVGDEKGLLKSLSEHAGVIVSDDFPCFFLPRMIAAASRMIDVRLELIDSNGLYPMRHTQKVFSRAFDFRRHLQKELLPHLHEVPVAEPLQGSAKQLRRLDSIPSRIIQRWPAADPIAMAQNRTQLQQALSRFPINHQVGLIDTIGGSHAANQRAQQFIQQKLARYNEDRNEPEREGASGLSPYLHFGHLSVHQLFDSIAQQADWSDDRVATKPTGQSSGWWGAPPAVESFWDELITWRELGYNMCAHSENYDQYESLPNWARLTLEQHELDRRPYLYSLEEFEQSQTHDRLWNAAQYQLVTRGVIHNYLRMLWGKKILEWSPNARSALATMIELNNKWAIDGRNPNSYSGIFWVLGRYDRAWNEREIFGEIRYMSSDNTARKYRVKDYVSRYSPVQKNLF